jgi:hypothetical protein
MHGDWRVNLLGATGRFGRHAADRDQAANDAAAALGELPR